MARTQWGDEAADREAPAPNLGPSTDVTLGDETMELIAYGDLEGAKARHDGSANRQEPEPEPSHSEST